MVGPSITDEDRSTFRRRLGAGFVLLVAASGAFTGLRVGAGPAWIAGFALAGAALGAVLALYLSWLGSEAQSKARNRARSRRPSTDFGEDSGTDDAESERKRPPKQR